MDTSLVGSISRQLTNHTSALRTIANNLSINTQHSVAEFAKFNQQYWSQTYTDQIKRFNSIRRTLRRLGEHKHLRLTTGVSLILGALTISSAHIVIANLNTSTDPIIEQYTAQSVSQISLSTMESIRASLDAGILSQGFIPGHYAVDLRSPIKSPIYPIMQGQVTTVVNSNTSGYGKYVIIDHGQNLQSLYAHMDHTTVTEGQTVVTDDIIGYVGITGHTTGPHLHLEVIDHGQRINPLILIGGRSR